MRYTPSLLILAVAFDSMLTFETHIRSVSRAASQRLGILRKSWRVFHDRLLIGRCFWGFVLPVLEHCSAVWCSAADTHLKLLDRIVTQCTHFVALYLYLMSSYVPVRVARCALISHRYTYAPPRC